MSKPTALAIAGPNFWTSAASNIGFHSDGDLLYVVLDDTAKMEVVLRSKGQMFTAAAAAAGARGLRVVVNANMYDISWGPLVGIAFGAGKPLDPAVITPIGRVVSASRTTGRSAPSLFYVAYKPGYEFGFGDPATAGMAAAVGGLGPIILNGLKYGTGNKYKPGTAAGGRRPGSRPHSSRPT